MTVEQVKAERAAFVKGAKWGAAESGVWPCCGERRTLNAEKEAARLYPMPMVEVPRVVMDRSGLRWEVRGDEVWCLRTRESALAGAFPLSKWAGEVTTERVRLWSDLLANPTEQRPADEVQGA